MSPTDAISVLPLWTHFVKLAKPAEQTAVTYLLSAAKVRLLQIRDTFPTYTLHDEEHALNVVRKMGELLGGQLSTVTSLEAAFLILSAYFHDTGMAFSPEERAQLPREEHFSVFLDKHPEAALAIEKRGGDTVPDDIAEWYCRWRHAERVFVLIHEVRNIRPDTLRWGTHDIGDMLGDLCRSHNLDTAQLKNDTMFPIDYRYECDVRFCAVLLRLADYLDFDASRTPEQLYRDLGLAQRRDKPGQTSDLEWRKHSVSEGFRFPARLEADYELGCLAGPTQPAVEHDIRCLLTDIEEEFARCSSIVRSCSDRWRNHPMPGSIDRTNIKSNGYKYGEHRFTLEQREVLELLMGDRLYDHPLVFVRELLQNALDTSRHREFYHHSSGNPYFKCDPIRVSQWTDRDGYRWIAVEDFGMGMTEAIINNFLLKVGRSYYKSAQFEADVIRYAKKTQRTFKPISQFGVGLLSCFIVGDRVEIATRHVRDDNGPIRLSLPGLQSFFVLQQRPQLFQPMPSAAGDTNGERAVPGTTVCVRLDPRKEIAGFDLRTELDRHVLCPPVRVSFDGEFIGGDASTLLDEPWCEPTTITLSADDTKRIGKVLGHTFKSPLQLRVVPIDLTKHSPTSDLKGQLIAVFIPRSDDLRAALRTKDVRYDSAYEPEEKHIAVRFAISPTGELTQAIDVNRRHRHRREDPERRKEASVAFDAASALRLPSAELKKLLRKFAAKPLSAFGHNGIALPERELRHQHSSYLVSDSLVEGQVGVTWGILMLQDRLRPELSVARDKIVNIPWLIYSACNLAVRRGIQAVGEVPAMFGAGALQSSGDADDDPAEAPLLGDLLHDELITDEAMWGSERVFSGKPGPVSVIELRRAGAIQIGITSRAWGNRGLDFNQTLRAVLARRWLAVSVDYYSSYILRINTTGGHAPPISEAETLFPPLLFVRFEDGDTGTLTGGARALRLGHPFSQWLLKVAPALAADLPGLLNQIRRTLLASQYTYAKGRLSSEHRAQQINHAMSRIKELRDDLAPPEQAYLTKEDFEEKSALVNTPPGRKRRSTPRRPA